MALKQTQQDNLYKAFGLFIEAFRPYIVSLLMQDEGDKWPAAFFTALHLPQQENWNQGIKSGTPPETLIDYQYLKAFAIRFKDLLRKDFGKDTNKLASTLETIYDVRNKLAHFQEIKEDEHTLVFIHMKNIARAIGMTELETELIKLQEGTTPASVAAITPSTPMAPGSPIPWFRVVSPHLDIRQGRLDESVFAANLAEVALGNGREIYSNPAVFFSKTYFTAGLKNVARTVIKGLNGNEDAENRVISLQTGFGGGKTHTLISLFHLCNWGRNATQSAYTADLLAHTGIPDFEKASIAVFTNTTNDPANGRHTSDGIHIQTIWGELAYQLGGATAYDIIKQNDEQLIAPGGLFKKVLEHCHPALILIDELADYCVKAAARKAGNSSLADQTISFMQELTEAIAGTNNCVAVITLPASPQEVGNTPEAQAILSSLQKRVSRVGADTQPVADNEIYEVIRRRLFEDAGTQEMVEAAASAYMNLYQQHWTELPPHANKSEYKKKIINSYPFHPELIDVFRIRWASHHDFQRTRGVLRLLAAIVSDLWKRQQSLPGGNILIHAGLINFSTLDALSGQLKKLFGNGYDSVISADVAGSSSNAFKIDSNKQEYGQWYLTQTLSSVILLNSFGGEGANKGISVPEIKLNLLLPDGFNHNNINGALDELEASAYYLYYSQTSGAGKRYWFNTKPNINILINQAKGDISQQDIKAEIIRRITERTKNKTLFTTLVDPSSEIPEQQKPTLVILSPDYLANPDTINGRTKPIIERIATKKGNSERVYRNTFLFLLCSEFGYSKLSSEVMEFLACQKISLEYKTQLESEQKFDLQKRQDEASKQSETALVAAYNIIVKYSVKNGLDKLLVKQFDSNLETQINNVLPSLLKEEEWLLDAVGLNTLRSNNLLPTGETYVKVKDVYEAFLRFDDKPMIKGPESLTTSLQRYCLNGEYAIATGDGKDFKKFFYKEQIPFFDITDDQYWLVSPDIIPKVDTAKPSVPSAYPSVPANSGSIDPNISNDPGPEPSQERIFNAITISGKVPLENYTQLFTSFIVPLMSNNIEIEIKIKGKSSLAKPISENSQEYKIIKESAKQLGLKLEEE